MIFAILLLAFLFVGEPDLWDNLHDLAMHVTSVKTECNGDK
jgi:hypothetical protein